MKSKLFVSIFESDGKTSKVIFESFLCKKTARSQKDTFVFSVKISKRIKLKNRHGEFTFLSFILSWALTKVSFAASESILSCLPLSKLGKNLFQNVIPTRICSFKFLSTIIFSICFKFASEHILVQMIPQFEFFRSLFGRIEDNKETF